MNLSDYLEHCKQLVNAGLAVKLPADTLQPFTLHQAMRYSVLNGGKRLRAAFIYAIGQGLGADEKVLTDIAVAIEMIHAFSIIHDDLPALDNDDLRRGKPTCHRVFGEATAILAGDALQSLAFEVLTNIDSKLINADIKIKMLGLLTRAIGSCGMIGGEQLDIAMVNKVISVTDLEQMYKLKTGCLLSASMQLAALAAINCDSAELMHNLNEFGQNIGLSFQIHDDIIGIESNTETLGKTQKVDIEANKPIYPSLVGMQYAKDKRDAFCAKALSYLDKIAIDSSILKELCAYIVKRDH